MTDLPASPRRYTDAEVRKLLERATQLQQTQPAPAEGSGLTLVQLESIAREAGIDVEAVRRAAAELDAGAVGVGHWSSRLAGAPMGVVLVRSLPGEAAEAAVEATIPLIQAAVDAPGQASRVGRTFTWQSRSQTSLRETRVVIRARNGETRIEVRERYSALAGTIFGSGVGGIGIGVGFGVGAGVGTAIGSALMIFGFPIAALGVTWLGSRALYSGIVNRRREALARLVDDLAESLTADLGG
ncbi:MAG: hypothetical protein ACOCUW_03155 [Gemmatimonadota bacterium]